LGGARCPVDHRGHRAGVIAERESRRNRDRKLF
jgi:hypothetical protein